MFFRESYSKKSPAPILQLIQGQRTATGVSQQLVISLGRMGIEKPLRKPVAQRVESLLTGQESFLPVPTNVESIAERIVQKIRVEGKWTQSQRIVHMDIPDQTTQAVFIDKVEHTHSCTLGGVLVAKTFWDRLQFSEMLKALGFSSLEIKTTAISIMSRLISPQSENNLPLWLPTTALPELLTVNTEMISKNRWYRISDKLMANQSTIEGTLAEREKTLYQLPRSIYLYDLTNTYFEGEQTNNPKAEYSKKSKEKRHDCPQVTVGLVVDGDGFPLRHKLFGGKTSDSSTLLGVIDELKAGLGPEESPTVIVDSGMSKPEHLAAIRAAGFHYLVTEKRPSRIQHEDIFFNDSLFNEISGREGKSGVRIYKEENGVADEVKLFCKSEGRKQKETAIKSHAHTKIQIDLDKLSKRCESKRLKDRTKIDQAIGRLKERHSRVSRFYELTILAEDTGYQLTWLHNTGETETKMDGCYVMKTSRQDLKDEEIWNLYMTLQKVEAGFRALKGVLGLRPNFHRKEERVDGHIFITILAYHLLRSIEHTLQSEGDTRSWPTIRLLLQTHCYTTMILPTVSGPVINIRKPGTPDSEQKSIYQKLRVSLHGLPIKKVIA